MKKNDILLESGTNELEIMELHIFFNLYFMLMVWQNNLKKVMETVVL